MANLNQKKNETKLGWWVFKDCGSSIGLFADKETALLVSRLYALAHERTAAPQVVPVAKVKIIFDVDEAEESET